MARGRSSWRGVRLVGCDILAMSAAPAFSGQYCPVSLVVQRPATTRRLYHTALVIPCTPPDYGNLESARRPVARPGVGLTRRFVLAGSLRCPQTRAIVASVAWSLVRCTNLALEPTQDDPPGAVGWGAGVWGQRPHGRYSLTSSPGLAWGRRTSVVSRERSAIRRGCL